MALAIYDENQTLINSSLHGYVDGVSGGVYEFQVFVRNADVTKYYTGVQLKYLVDGAPDWFDPATSRINVRMHTPISSGQTGTRPSAFDWKAIIPSDTVALPNIGNSSGASSAYYPVWIRVFVPGGTAARNFTHGLRIVATEAVV
jgi:hypothetical protein